jgi:glycogen phosphorylase
MSSPAYTSRPSSPSVIESLTQLALDLHWSFDHSADELWRRLEPELWELTHNPWVVLQTASKERLESAATDANFQALLADVQRKRKSIEESEIWFQKAHPQSGISTVAYFSMEFMLSESLPIYSGGLGNVAGDQLKTACDLGLPVAGVSLLYQQGYFRQEIDANGWQQALYPFNDPGQLPIRPLRDPNGEWLRISLEFPGSKVWIRTWVVQVGSAKLYLLDTNDPANIPQHRGITSELYGGGPELRLKQELVLGVGGWRLLKALGLQPEVCHLNEGHAAFAVLERARSHMAANKQPFDLALEITRAGNLFTTHTPVAAGFDRFDPGLIRWYMKKYAEEVLAIPFDNLMALGRQNPSDSSEPFNMAYLAFRASGGVNGVSKLHGETSRRIFQALFPRWPEAEVPVNYVTNGVHAPTWDSAAAARVWELACGENCWRETTENLEQSFRKVSDTDLWRLRTASRGLLVDYVRIHHALQLARRGAPLDTVKQAAHALDPAALTLGFARRFATYKRPNLLLHDPDRLIRILTNREFPVQLVLAGKAHPQDGAGQEMIHEWYEFSLRPEVHSRVVFLSDYDVFMAEHLVQGADVWVNTPRRPWEASGTSGMKVLVNGGLNLSELDGWWAEAYSPELGWAIGDGREHDDPAWDVTEAEALYNLLEREVIPEFYNRDSRGIPIHWVARMRESMARLTPAYSTNRVVRQYSDNYYLSAASKYKDRAADQGARGTTLLRWQQELAKHWPSLRFGAATLKHKDGMYLFQTEVILNDLDPNAIAVELFANPQNGSAAERHTMTRGNALPNSPNAFSYTGTIPARRPASDYTPRLIPQHPGALVPLEAPYILWHESPSWR